MNNTKNTTGEKNVTESGVLYLVATPIGNMSDISERAVKVLRECSFVAAEDTRNTGLMLERLGISKPIVSYYEHNKHVSGETILRRLSEGETCALVTDAGTPSISDPGSDIVCLCIAADITVRSVPGACACITALTLSGLDTKRFVFEGFLSKENSARKKRLTELSSEGRTIVLYVAPHGIKAALGELLAAFGNRHVSVCRELTKRNEEVIRTDIEGAVRHFSDTEPRGEFVLVIEGKQEDDSPFWLDLGICEHVDFYVKGGMDIREAIKAAAQDRGVAKNVIYKEYHVTGKAED